MSAFKMQDGNVRLTDLQFKSKNGNMVKIAKVEYTPLSTINTHQLNREYDYNHINTLSIKIEDNNFLDTIKVFPMKEDGTYDAAEGNHRVLSLQDLIPEEDWDKVMIPISILPEPDYDTNDKEGVIDTLIQMNKDNKAWTMLDYVTRWAQISSKKTFQEMSKEMKKYEKNGTFAGMTNPLICSIWTGEASGYQRIKDGVFQLSDTDKIYKDMILETIYGWIQLYGISKRAGVFPTFNQRTAVALWKHIEYLREYDMSSEAVRIDEFGRRLDFLSENISRQLAQVQLEESMAKTKREKLPSENPLPTDSKKILSKVEDIVVRQYESIHGSMNSKYKKFKQN